MKTTIEISDSIFREVKARASLKGQTMKAFFIEALKDKLVKESQIPVEDMGWRKVFGKASQDSVSEIQTVIDAEFSQIDLEGWQ